MKVAFSILRLDGRNASQVVFKNALVLAIAISSAAALALPDSNKAIADYKAGKYSVALAQFLEISKAYPNNGMVHYYIALCRQCLGHSAEAKHEYELAANYGNPSLKSLAEAGIAQLSKLKTKVAAAKDDDIPPPPTSAPPPPATDAKAAAKPGEKPGDTKTETTKVTNNPSVAAKPRVKKIIEFVTSWDNTCNRFEPTFEQTKSQFKDIEFQKLDIEEASNEALKTKYNVNPPYPTIVYLDASGKVMDTGTGAPPMGEEFASHIHRLNGNLK